MSSQVVVTEISGGTYPISIYISDIYGNNQTLLSVITSGPVPPIINYTSIPSIFMTAPEILLKMVDVNNCEVFKVLACVFGDYIITQDDIPIITQNGQFLILQQG